MAAAEIHPHWSNTSVHEIHPVDHLVVLSCALWKRELVLGVVSLNQVGHDTTRLEEVDLLSIGKGVGQCWNATIGVNGEKWCLFLLVLAELDLVCLVLETLYVRYCSIRLKMAMSYPSSSRRMEILMPLGVFLYQLCILVTILAEGTRTHTNGIKLDIRLARHDFQQRNVQCIIRGLFENWVFYE